MRIHRFYISRGRAIRDALTVSIVFVALIVLNITSFSLIRADRFLSGGATGKKLSGSSSGIASVPRLAIVIDGFGGERDGVREALSINGRITMAVTPFLTNSMQDADLAHKNGYELLVSLNRDSLAASRHIPGNESNASSQGVLPDPGTYLASIPYASGFKFGSPHETLQEKNLASSLLDFSFRKGLDVVGYPGFRPGKDNTAVKGHTHSVDICLGDHPAAKQVRTQLEKAAGLALKEGIAVAEAHTGVPGAADTAAAISEMISVIEQMGVHLVFISELDP